MTFEVEVEVILDEWTTKARIVRIACGDWLWNPLCPVHVFALGLTTWEIDYLRELGLLAFRHSRLAWSGARSWAAVVAASGEGVKR